ncbi:MAG: YebC/PmpR family DNA-binding transcriptional regulator [Anaerolineales bacterium]|nr:YebC/PmpR family DNA-binding transcriptional regulator [Anaerolineales bacterium]
MAGHSKWANIKHQKKKEDKRRGKLFTKLSREIEIAAREGGDPEVNFNLRIAIDRAKDANMPNDNIERAIKRGTGEDRDASEMEQIHYEGYAPHGVALIIKTITDNRNRTVADIRHILSKYGGNMGQGGSVAWQFTRKSFFVIPADGHDYNTLFKVGLESGAEDVIEDEEYFEIVGSVDVFKEIHDSLKEKGIKTENSGLRMDPDQEIDLDLEKTFQVMKVIEELEDLDDVQIVYSNLRVSDQVLEELEKEHV